MKPNLNERQLCARVETVIKQQAYFLLLYDVVRSKSFAEKRGTAELYRLLEEFHKEVNTKFFRFICRHEIAIGNTLEKFGTIVGDGGGAYFQFTDVTHPILRIAE